MKKILRKKQGLVEFGVVALGMVACVALSFSFMTGTAHSQARGGSGYVDPYAGYDFSVIDPGRGPVDMGLRDPALVGAIDIHEHLDADAPGSGGKVRSLDLWDASIIGAARGLRGLVMKTHQDFGSAQQVYLVRKHAGLTNFELYARMANNMSTGGINVAALEHWISIKGGYGRIFEMPTRDSCGKDGKGGDPSEWKAARPWMLMMPPGSPTCIPTQKNGELLPEVKYLIAEMAKVRTLDANGKLILATGHATNDEHLLIAKEGRKDGLHVLLTHPGDIPAVAEAIKLGATAELTAHFENEKNKQQAADFVKKYGAENIAYGTDCGQNVKPFPTDCMSIVAKGMRARGVTEHELDLMYKVNPAKLLFLDLPTEAEMGHGMMSK